MSHHQKTDIATSQIIFQPLRHIKVEVIGRLIQNQEIRLRDKHIRQSNTFELSSREMLHLLIEITDFKLRKNLFCLSFIIPGFFMFHACQQVLHSRITFGFHTPFIFLNKLHGSITVMETRFKHSQFFGIVRILLQVAYTQITTKHNATFIITFFSGYNIQ